MSTSAIVEAIYKACTEKRKITVTHYNVHSFNLSMQIPWFYDFLQDSDITHCDSMGVLNAIRSTGLDLPKDYRVSYTLLMPKLLELCNRHGFSVFLLGSRPQYLQMALDRLGIEYPNIKLAGHDGYFSTEDPYQNEAVIEQINLVKPQILLVGMGMPTQENWVRLNRHRLSVNAIMTGGAVIDRLAGVVPGCPELLSNIGLEWLYRLFREPKRLASRYLLGNPAFLLQLALAKSHASPAKVLNIQPNSNLTSEHRHNSNDFLPNSSLQNSSSTQAKVKRLGDYLVEAGLLTQANIDTALTDQAVTGMRLGEILVKQGWIEKQTVEYFVKRIILPDQALAKQNSFLLQGC
jgi:N-acetylglucosaminyldiphosphoundecaprenol N-acetyl-beta-D-mannosaminyltransferase